VNDHQSFQRLAAILTILSMPCYLISVLLLAALNYDFSPEAFSGTIISISLCGANLLRWGIDLLRQPMQID